MGLITGKYLEDPHHPDLDFWEPTFPPEIDESWQDIPGDWDLEDMERLFMALLRTMDKGAIPFSVPCVEMGDCYCALSREAVGDLTQDARDKVLHFPSQLIATRLIKEEDEEVLPESLAKKLLKFAGIARPEDPFTLSFSAAADIVLVFLSAEEE
jgi:hypothetical protein